VIIPAKNSEATIGRCLESIKNQTYPKIATIVVDNYSIDETCKIAERFGAKVCLIRSERSSAKNLGTKVAQGKYVYDVDSDSFVEPTVVEECIRKCEEEGFDAIAIHNTSDATISFWSRVRKMERDCYRDDELNVGARFFNKEVYTAIGGYDETLIAGEDYDIHNRLLERGFRVGRIASQEIHIGEPRTLQEIARKHIYYGKYIRSYIQKNPKKARKQFSVIRPAYVKNWRKFLKNPSLTVGFTIYQIVRYFATALGYLSSAGGSR
jgi:glycosyltransferase involved in cell wall biosynthesis